MLLGGTTRTRGFKEYLEWRLTSCWHLAPESTEGIERVAVAPLPDGIEPDTAVWRGGANLSYLEAARGMWVLQTDWLRKGPMAARAAAGFAW